MFTFLSQGPPVAPDYERLDRRYHTTQSVAWFPSLRQRARHGVARREQEECHILANTFGNVGIVLVFHGSADT